VELRWPFPGGTTELFEEIAIHECKEMGKRGAGLMEWLSTHPNDSVPFIER